MTYPEHPPVVYENMIIPISRELCEMSLDRFKRVAGYLYDRIRAADRSLIDLDWGLEISDGEDIPASQELARLEGREASMRWLVNGLGKEAGALAWTSQEFTYAFLLLMGGAAVKYAQLRHDMSP